MSYQEAIKAAQADGRNWVLLEHETGLGGDPDAFRCLEFHVPTGVIVRYGTGFDHDGQRVYQMASLFHSRKTGEPLACGSREWNVGHFASLAELEAGVVGAKADVTKRFAGLIKVTRRQQGLEQADVRR